MLGLADRSQTLTLFENLVNGNMEAVLKDISEQYTNGATPMIVLQDLINITHDLAKVKIIPALLNSTSLSEIEKKRLPHSARHVLWLSCPKSGRCL